MAQVNQILRPGFSVQLVMGTVPTISFTVMDRNGNVVNLTGYTLKLAAKATFNRANSQNQIVPTDVTLFDIQATITDAPNGNITIAFTGQATGLLGTFYAAFRLWATATVNRPPDDEYQGTVVVNPLVVKSEA